MGIVVTFEDYTPPPRYDSLPWTDISVRESSTEDGTYTEIDSIAISPVDPDPSDPAAQSFTTQNGTDTDLWYRIVFVDADGDESQPSSPVQNSTSSDPGESPYTTATELFRILKIRTPTTEQTAAAERVLAAAALEINSELDRTTSFSDPAPGLVVEVNLNRAAELWKMQEVQFGLVGVGSEFGATRISRDTWEKWALQLTPLKEQWGLA